MNNLARTGARSIGMAALVAAGLCAVAGSAAAAGEALYLTAELGKTTFGGGPAHYDSVAVERLAGTGMDATIGQSRLDKTYSQHRFRSFGMRWQGAYSALEIGYLNLGKAFYAASGVADDGGGPVDLATDLSVRSRGPALSISGILPLGTTWQLEVRGGAYYGKTSTVWSATLDGFDTGTYSDRKHEISPLLGAALITNVGGRWAVSLGYSRFFDVANRSVERLSLGVSVVLREP